MPALRGGNPNSKVLISFGSESHEFAYEYKANPRLTGEGFQRSSTFLRYEVIIF